MTCDCRIPTHDDPLGQVPVREKLATLSLQMAVLLVAVAEVGGIEPATMNVAVNSMAARASTKDEHDRIGEAGSEVLRLIERTQRESRRARRRERICQLTAEIERLEREQRHDG